MFPATSLTFAARQTATNKTDYVVLDDCARMVSHGPTLAKALASATGKAIVASYAFEPGAGDLLACQAAGVKQVYFAWSRRDAQRFAIKLQPHGLQRVREYCRVEYEPLWAKPNPTSLLGHIDANCIRSPSAKRVLFKEFHKRFQEWLSAGDKAHWGKIRVARELGERGFPVTPGTANKRYVCNLLFTTD